MERRKPAAFGSALLGPPEQSTHRLRVRIQLLLTVLLIGTNLAGAAIVFVLFALVIPSPAPDKDTLLALKIAVPAYVGVAIFVGAAWGTAGGLRAHRWVFEGRTPDDDERLRALGVPWFLTRIQAGLWIVDRARADDDHQAVVLSVQDVLDREPPV